MTFEELIKRVASDNAVPNHKAEAIIRDALELARDEALRGNTAPLFPGIGRFIGKAVRSTGRTPSGAQWTKPGRVKLGLSPSIHSGAPRDEKKSAPSSSQAA